jgi:hypothetical protein
LKSKIEAGTKPHPNLEHGVWNAILRRLLSSSDRKGFDFSQLIANAQAYQAKLLEVTQANMQFVFDFSQRLATIRSPFEFLAVITEFTGRRIIMIGKHSKELSSFWRIDAFRELAALPASPSPASASILASQSRAS